MIQPYFKARPALLPYSLFDFANSSISLIIHAYAFPLYFKTVLFANSQHADMWWGIAFAGSALLAAGAAPFIGRFADGSGRFQVFTTLATLSFVSVGLLAASIGGNAVLIVAAFVVANVGFFLASNVYDSLLVIIAPENRRYEYSGFAWGFGYLGGVLCFIGVYIAQSRYGLMASLPYWITAIFYASFGALAVRGLKKYAVGNIRTQSVSLREMLNTLSIPRLQLLIGYWLLADAINAIIVFTAIYGSTTLHLSAMAIGAFLLAVQLLAFPSTYLMSRLISNVGAMRGLQICVAIWVLVIAIIVTQTSTAALYVITVLTALVIGTTQSVMRAQYSLYLDSGRPSETFGWYAIATESASIVAPLLFGVVAGVFGSERLAMALLAMPLCVGVIFVSVGVTALDRVQLRGLE